MHVRPPLQASRCLGFFRLQWTCASALFGPCDSASDKYALPALPQNALCASGPLGFSISFSCCCCGLPNVDSPRLHPGAPWLCLPSGLSWDLPVDTESWDALRTTVLPVHVQPGNVSISCHAEQIFEQRETKAWRCVLCCLSPGHSLSGIDWWHLVAAVLALHPFYHTPQVTRSHFPLTQALLSRNSGKNRRLCHESARLQCVSKNVVKGMPVSSAPGWRSPESSTQQSSLAHCAHQGHVVHNGINYFNV